jgi:hypothetical protein
VTDSIQSGGFDDELPLVPLVIGVTGHRDLFPDDVKKLRGKVAEIFQRLRDRFPDTPFLVLSPLAEGADRIVARVALDHFQARLIAPLPLPKEVYEQDFVGPSAQPGSLEEFQTLLARGTYFTLPLVEGCTPENIREHGPHRNAQYAQVGAYIVRRCQVLIALWDGNPFQKGEEGGTAEIIEWARTRVPPPFGPEPGPLDVNEPPVIYHIVTPRKKTGVPRGEPCTCCELKFEANNHGQGESDHKGKKLAENRRLEYEIPRAHDFNGRVRRLASLMTDDVGQSISYVVPSEFRRALPGPARSILPLYGMADTLAIRYQRENRATLRWLIVFALLAVLAFELYAHLPHYPPRPWALIFYPVFLCLALGTYAFFVRHLDIQNKYLDFRALAEGLRVQLFWRVAGVREEVVDHYLLNLQSELAWIRNAIRAWNVPRETVAPHEAESSDDNDLAKFNIVLQCWVHDQWKFFFKNTKRDDGREYWVKLLTWVIIVASFILSLTLFTVHLALTADQPHEIQAQPVVSPPERPTPFRTFATATSAAAGQFAEAAKDPFDFDRSLIHELWILVLGMLPALAAAAGAYGEFMAYSAQAKRYEWMAALFARAFKRLDELVKDKKFDRARQLLFHLGKEALAENGNWVLLHRERPLEPPVG